MILQDEFRNNEYKDILVNNDEGCSINLNDIYDINQKPKELLGIFVSKQNDDMFFVLDGDSTEINHLCDQWDERIRVFAIINDKLIHKLKYNIVQLIVYSGDAPDKSREGNLLISRKIIIKGNMADKNRIEIDEDEAIELPFYMVPSDTFVPDNEQKSKLNMLLPDDEYLFTFLKEEHKKSHRNKENTVRTFSNSDFDKIKEWLEK